ncbi:helix-turn-helix domain-containing protein [Vibrio sp. PP-XX7]
MILKTIHNHEKRYHVALTVEKVVMDALMNFNWQGNNSELRNRMERILLNRSSNLIKLNDIPDEIKLNVNQGYDPTDLQVLPMEEVEKKAIIQAWNIYDGRMTEMAKALQIGRTTLWRKINKFGLADKIELN